MNNEQQKRMPTKLAYSDEDSDGEPKNSGYNETSSIYQIHKILSSD